MKKSKKSVLREFQPLKLNGLNKVFGGTDGSTSTGDNDCTTKGGVGADCQDLQTSASADTVTTNSTDDACKNLY